MIKQLKQAVVPSCLLMSAMHATALKPFVHPESSQDYVFIENNLDKEYFIAPKNTDPRFTGANVWTKYNVNQTSLGYMGYNRLFSYNYQKPTYVDYWITGGNIDNPYLGQRCQTNYTNCPASGIITPDYKDRYGAYKIPLVLNADDGLYTRAIFSDSAYEYFKNQSVGTVNQFNFEACATTEEYSPQLGTFCRDASSGNWYTSPFKVTKKGHITLTDTKAFQEIWYGTDGTPYLDPNAMYCKNDTVLNIKGITCKMVKYNIQGTPTFADFGPVYLSMKTDNAALKFTPLANDLLINGGTANWYYHNADTLLYLMVTTGDNYLSVFFNNHFFQSLAKAKVNIRNADNLFTFAVRDTAVPQSGFYQFSMGTKIELIPREYSVSIQPKGLPEGTTPVKSGKINDTQPISFEYIVKQSAPRQADTIKAYVNAESVMKNGETYCLFKSADNKLQVPIPAWLSMKDDASQEIKQYSGCDINKRLDMRSARWSAEPWDSFGSGYFYRTDLKLIFPMDHPVSQHTVDDVDWEGKVRAEGEIKIEAQWNGVNFP